VGSRETARPTTAYCLLPATDHPAANPDCNASLREQPRGRRRAGTVRKVSCERPRRLFRCARRLGPVRDRPRATVGSQARRSRAAGRAAPVAVRLPSPQRGVISEGKPWRMFGERSGAASSGLVGFRRLRGRRQEGPALVGTVPRRIAPAAWEGEPAGRACPTWLCPVVTGWWPYNLNGLQCQERCANFSLTRRREDAKGTRGEAAFKVMT
jgi:hypothetical protein